MVQTIVLPLIIQILKLLMIVPLDFTDILTYIPNSELIMYLKELAWKTAITLKLHL